MMWTRVKIVLAHLSICSGWANMITQCPLLIYTLKIVHIFVRNCIAWILEIILYSLLDFCKCSNNDSWSVYWFWVTWFYKDLYKEKTLKAFHQKLQGLVLRYLVCSILKYTFTKALCIIASRVVLILIEFFMSETTCFGD